MQAVNEHCFQFIAASRYYQGNNTIQKGKLSLFWEQLAVFLVGFHHTNKEIFTVFISYT